MPDCRACSYYIDVVSDVLAGRRQESISEAPASFGQPTTAQQRVPDRNVANQLSSELHATFPLPVDPVVSSSIANTGATAGTGSNAKRHSADGEVENRQKKTRI